MKNIKALFMLLLFILPALPCFAQQKAKFHIVSFAENPHDTSPQIYEKLDSDGHPYAIIKVKSNNPDDELRAYNFSFGLIPHIVEVKDGELWVYVGRNAKHVSISRDGYQSVQRYDLGLTIQPGRAYEMQLSSQRQSAKFQMVRFNISPANAKAMVMCQKELSDEDEMVFGYADEGGSVARNLEIGTYTYKIISDTYHTSEGRFVLDAKKNIHIEHVTLRPNFANVTFKVSDGVDVYINEEKKSTGEWSGVLKAGTHRVGSKKKKHNTVYIDVEVKAGMDTVINLPDPKPVVGTLAIVSSPLDAKILIDGQDYGHTPKNIDGLLIGNHTLEIIKEGYLNEIREIEIIEDEITDCNVTLAKGSSTKTQTSVVARNALNDNFPVIYDSNGIRRSQRTKTVKGVVIDKNGYPVVGAIVHAAGGKVNTTVANDGTFSMEVPEWLKSVTVKHKGFPNKKMKIHDGEMLVKMKKREWFLNFVGGYSFEQDNTYRSNIIKSGAKIGLMFGTVSNWGWYVKPLYCIESEGFSLAGGITKRFSQPLFLYAGIGFTTIIATDGLSNEKSLIPKVDLGLLIRPTTHFNINFGCSGFLGEYKRPGSGRRDAMHGIGILLNLGVGYVF